MSRNASGVYSLPVGYLATTDATATATQHNTPLEDLETDMNTARPVVAGGTGATNASDARDNLGVTSELSTRDATIALKAPLASPALTGNPTAPTQSESDNSTKIATTAYVERAAAAVGGRANLLGESTISSATSNVLFNGLMTGHDTYELRFWGLDYAATSGFPSLVFGDAGTPVATGYYGYYREMSGTGNPTTYSNSNEMRLGSSLQAASSVSGAVNIFPSLGAESRWSMQGEIFQGRGSVKTFSFSGFLNSDSTVNSVEFQLSASCDGGKLELWGLS